MSPPEVWGPPTWTFLHTFVEKVKENAPVQIYEKMFFLIKMICKNLPCPYCASDATKFLNNINLANIKSKKQLKDTIYLFHNYVNNKKKKPLFNYINMQNYSSKNVVVAANNFIRVYHTRGNMQQLSESFQRQLVIKTFKKWLKENIMYFNS
jgi:hypothetical protein